MRYKCIDNRGRASSSLTLGKIYIGYLIANTSYIKIETCDDNKSGIFLSQRFEEVEQ